VAKGYEVTGTRTISRIGDMNQIVDLYEVSFKTETGVTSSIRVPVPATLEEIKVAVDAEAEKLNSIMNL